MAQTRTVLKVILLNSLPSPWLYRSPGLSRVSLLLSVYDRWKGEQSRSRSGFVYAQILQEWVCFLLWLHYSRNLNLSCRLYKFEVPQIQSLPWPSSLVWFFFFWATSMKNQSFSNKWLPAISIFLPSLYVIYHLMLVELAEWISCTVGAVIGTFGTGEISPLLPNSCRYTPTCSEYSMEAYKKYGVVKGTVLTAWRLCRCNPLGDP